MISSTLATIGVPDAVRQSSFTVSSSSGEPMVQVPKTAALLNLSGRVAMVTGASQGIGACIARRFAEAGASVVIHFRSKAEEAAAVAASIRDAGGNALGVQAELADAAAANYIVQQAVGHFGTLDIL